MTPLNASPASCLALGQGLFYVVMGLWPAANIASFMAVTGKKTDVWLVKTAGLLIAVIGAAILAGRTDPGPQGLILAAGSAAALAAVDIVYCAKRVISPVYLFDAAVESLLVVAWAMWAAGGPSAGV